MNTLNKIVKRAKQPLIITPRLDTYLLSHPEAFPLSDETAALMQARMQVRPRERSGTFSSSSRGACMRRQVFEYMGAPTAYDVDIVKHNLFADGHWRHLRWQALLMEAGLIDEIEYPFTITDQVGKVWVTGSLDGINLRERWGLEIKGIRSVSLVAAEPLPKHLLQIHTYMLGTSIETFVLLYEDKSTSDWREYVIHRDAALDQQVRDEISELMRCAMLQRLPDVLEECAHGKGPTYAGCPYRRICLSTPDWRAVPVGLGSTRRGRPTRIRRERTVGAGGDAASQ